MVLAEKFGGYFGRSRWKKIKIIGIEKQTASINNILDNLFESSPTIRLGTMYPIALPKK